jgi:two-component system sensor histidine kinase VicK
MFVAPYKSPYEMLWVVLAVGMDMVFKGFWMYFTLLLYAITGVFTFYRTHQPKSLEIYFSSTLYFIGVFAVSYLISKYRKVSDEERLALDSTSRATDFERQRLLSLINNMGEAVVATDSRGKILIYNAATLALLDTNQSLENKSLDSILNLRNEKHRSTKLFSLLKSNSVGITTTDLTHEFAPNDFINLYINASPIKLGFKEESKSGYIIIMRDVTKETSLEEERDEFISVVSHELRTPVAIAEGNISNAIFMNSQKKEPKIIAESLDSAHDQVVFLASMINDLATLSRAERTDVPLDIETVDLKELVHSIARDYESQASTKGLKLTVGAAEDAKTIDTAPLYLREILQNFVTNSIKYTKKGSVIVHVRKNNKGEAVFSVADTGIGLSKADRKRVFDKFFRSEDFRTRESSGTGLGLYVTAKLANRLGATITVDSELNKGSTFTITVPSIKR